MKRLETQTLDFLLTQNYIGLLRLLLQYFGAVQIAIDKPYFSILACYLGTFVTVAYKAGNLILRMSVSDLVESITANIACGADAVGSVSVR